MLQIGYDFGMDPKNINDGCWSFGIKVSFGSVFDFNFIHCIIQLMNAIKLRPKILYTDYCRKKGIICKILNSNVFAISFDQSFSNVFML